MLSSRVASSCIRLTICPVGAAQEGGGGMPYTYRVALSAVAVGDGGPGPLFDLLAGGSSGGSSGGARVEVATEDGEGPGLRGAVSYGPITSALALGELFSQASLAYDRLCSGGGRGQAVGGGQWQQRALLLRPAPHRPATAHVSCCCCAPLWRRGWQHGYHGGSKRRWKR